MKSPLSVVAGIFDAANFAYGVNPAIPAAKVSNSPGASGVQTLTMYYPSVVLGDGTYFNPFSTNAPIIVGSGANQETVTPSAVALVTGGPAGLTVNVTATFANIHGQGELVASGTFGLQEAINYASSAFGSGSVVVGGPWVQLGGTAAIINAAVIQPNTAIIDARGSSNSVARVFAVNGAIDVTSGTAVITKATAAAMTLAAPTAGINDGLILRIVSSTAAAHVVTTPANKINGADDTATFAAAAGNSIELIAYQGVWYATNLTGVTLSEV